ncbi:unnamed protein product [Phytomonas sp. EM1]|nr:unnamed protein product [Phytomonas sp. EM1]|eukprot:CCW60055.1 unnamed protein product [Phytomonas sp. isolate EM1]
MADFNCAICLDLATDPVVTRCGHLFCWGCLDHWLNNPNGALDCPVCKGCVDERVPGDIIPLYGKGKRVGQDPRPPPQSAEARDNAAHSETYDVPSVTAYSINCAEHPVAREQVRPHGASAYNRGSTYSQSNSSHTNSVPHPRPNAPRAPPPPRRTPHVHPFQYRHRGGLPLAVGSSFFFLGGNFWMTLAFVAAWAIYHFVAWREWRTVVRDAYQRLSRRITQRADSNSNSRHDQDNNSHAPGQGAEVPPPSNSASFTQEREVQGQQQQVVELSDTLIRNVVLWAIFVVILTNFFFIYLN